MATVPQVYDGEVEVNVEPNALEPTRQALEELVRITTERVIEHVSTLSTQRASDTSGLDDAARAVVEPLPETGMPLEQLLDLFFGRILPKGFNCASPGTLSHVNGGGLFHSALADFIGLATNPYVGYYGTSPGCAQIDTTVVRWFCDLLRLPESAGGILTSGASMATLTAIVTARTLRLGDNFGKGTLYTSDQVHQSVHKGVRVAGFPMQNLRILPSDNGCRLPAQVLADAIARDRDNGYDPCLVIANAGTTDTGVVDDLNALADVAERERVWLHVDAAYGGFFALTSRGRDALAGIDRADFVAMDPHKSLFLPYGTGCLLARRVADLEAAHLAHSDYIDGVVHLGEEGGATNAADLSLEMTRDFRGIRAWFPLKLLGAARFREYLDEKLDLARWLVGRLRTVGSVEVIAEPQLSVVVFRVVKANATTGDIAALNQRIIHHINARGRVHVAETNVKGRYAIRICVLSFRAHRRQLEMLLEDLRDAITAEFMT